MATFNKRTSYSVNSKMSTAPTQSNKLVFAEQEPAFWQEMAAFLLARHSRVELKAAMRQDKHKASEARIVHRRVWHDIRECFEKECHSFG